MGIGVSARRRVLGRLSRAVDSRLVQTASKRLEVEFV